MTEKMEEFIAGQKRIFANEQTLMRAAQILLNKIGGELPPRTVTIGNCNDFSTLGLHNLFFGAVKSRDEKLILNVLKLKTRLQDDFPVWLEALSVTSSFVRPQKNNDFEDFFASLRFVLPKCDWYEFISELKREFTQNSTSALQTLQCAWEAAVFLHNLDESIAPAELGAKLFFDSKIFKSSGLITWTAKLLKQIAGIEEDISAREILGKFGLSDNPTASTVILFGPFVYETQNKKMDWIKQLWALGESAILSDDNLSFIERLEVELPVLTVENETPFNRLKHESKDFALVYTAGFPGKAVQKLIRLLPADVPLFHWGDSDPEGLEIAAILNRLHALKLFRCNIPELERLKHQSIPLSAKKQKRAERLMSDPTFPFKEELGWGLRNKLWLEQESWSAESDR